MCILASVYACRLLTSCIQNLFHGVIFVFALFAIKRDPDLLSPSLSPSLSSFLSLSAPTSSVPF